MCDVSGYDGELDLHAGELADGWQVDPPPMDERYKEAEELVQPEVDVCPEGCGLISVADQSTETSGAEEAERHYHVIWLECGHEIALGPLPLPRPVD